MARSARRDRSSAPVSGVGIGEDLTFQYRVWAAQRAAWYGIAVVLGLGLTGLFGDGGFFRQRSQNGGTSVTFDRYARRGSAVVIQVDTMGDASAALPVKLMLGDETKPAVDSIEPAPQRDVWDDLYRVVWFAPGTATIHLGIRHRSWGAVEMSLGVGADPPLQIRQFVFP